MNRLKDRRALITGGGTGIGRAIAEVFTAEGCKVVICGRRHGPLAETMTTLLKNTKDAHFVECDIIDPNDVTDLAGQTQKLLGGLDILVNNAGIFEPGDIENTELASWDRVININLRGAFLVTKACMSMLRKSGKGNVINISSSYGHKAEQDAMAYCISKAALDMFTRCGALDYAKAGIRFNAVSPAVIDTAMHDRDKAELGFQEWRNQMAYIHPLGTVGVPRDVAYAALFLASDDSAWITGTNLPIDGGVSAK
ncbi:MAG: SDR family oxidoreductase [Planctomycetes bacterium]|nr:SDR family oxidoreductase [Planctomycetota bacterium]